MLRNVDCYRRFGPILKGQSAFSSWIASSLKIGPTGCLETSVTNYQLTLGNIQEERRFHHTFKFLIQQPSHHLMTYQLLTSSSNKQEKISVQIPFPHSKATRPRAVNRRIVVSIRQRQKNFFTLKKKHQSKPPAEQAPGPLWAKRDDHLTIYC
jgi:hypothetical protein